MCILASLFVPPLPPAVDKEEEEAHWLWEEDFCGRCHPNLSLSQAKSTVSSSRT